MLNHASLPPRARKVADEITALVAHHNRATSHHCAKLKVRWGRVRIRVARRGYIGMGESAEGWIFDLERGSQFGNDEPVRDRDNGPFKTFREAQAFIVGVASASAPCGRDRAVSERRRQGDARMTNEAEWDAFERGATSQHCIEAKSRNA